jgi:hypothetical protein
MKPEDQVSKLNFFCFRPLNRPLEFNETLVQPPRWSSSSPWSKNKDTRIAARLPLDVSAGIRHLSSRTRRIPPVPLVKEEATGRYYTNYL